MNRPSIASVTSPGNTPTPVKSEKRRKRDSTRCILTDTRSCRFRRMLLSSFRSCSAHFSLRTSSSIVFPSNFLRSEFLFHPAFQPADPGPGIGFTDTCDFRDLLVVVTIQIKQDERPAQRIQLCDEFVKELHFIRLALRF